MAFHNYFSDPYADAAAAGLVVVVPQRDELQLDIDTPEDLEHYEQMRQLLQDTGYYVQEVRRTKSVSGNTHVYVRALWTERLSVLERIMLQAMLGSDRKRELLSYLRHKSGDKSKPPTVLFERPEELAAA